MPFRTHSLIGVVALCAEMCLHTTIFAFIAVAMFAQKAGAYGALQFSMDLIVMFAIAVLMLVKYKCKDAEPSRVPNVICFSIIFLVSLMGAMGLAYHAASGNDFCEEFLSSHPEKCREAGFTIAMSWTSVIIAIAGILISWLDKYPGAVEVTRLYAPHRSVGGTGVLGQQSPRKPMDVSPYIYIPRPPPSYTVSRPRDPHHHTRRSTQPTSPQTLPRYSQALTSDRVPSSPLPPFLSRGSDGLRPLMLHRKMNGPAGQTPRNHPAFM